MELGFNKSIIAEPKFVVNLRLR